MKGLCVVMGNTELIKGEKKSGLKHIKPTRFCKKNKKTKKKKEWRERVGGRDAGKLHGG